jgi:hypothetical protein
MFSLLYDLLIIQYCTGGIHPACLVMIGSLQGWVTERAAPSVVSVASEVSHPRQDGLAKLVHE